MDTITNNTIETAPWWGGIRLRLGARELAWGVEHEIVLGRPWSLTLDWSPNRQFREQELGLQFRLPPDPESFSTGEGAVWNVRMNIMAPGRLAASQDWGQFAVQRYTGETLLTLSYNGQPVRGAECLLRFVLSREDQARYDYMLDALQGEDLTVTHVSERIVGRVGGYNITPRSRLEARWAALRHAHEQLALALPPILTSPHTALHYDQRVIEWSKHTSQHNLAGAMPAPGTPWMPAPARTGTGAKLEPLPKRFSVRSVRDRTDTPANRYVRNTIDLLIAESRSLEKRARERIEEAQTQLADPQQPLHPRWRQWLEESIEGYGHMAESARRLRKRSTESWLTAEPMRSMPSASPRATDLVWRDNTYYRRVRTVRANMERELQAAENSLFTDDRVTPAASINQVYEFWLATTLLKTLHTALGCQPTRWGERPIAGNPSRLSSYLPPRGGSVEMLSPSGKRLVLRFDMEYPSVWLDPQAGSPWRRVAYGVDRRAWPDAKGRPDLALEIWENNPEAQVPQIVVFDATWSARLDTHVLKFLYRESIRDFTRSGASGKPARPVVATWVVYPGSLEEVDHEDDYATGQLPLDPGPNSEGILADYLGRIPALADALA